MIVLNASEKQPCIVVAIPLANCSYTYSQSYVAQCETLTHRVIGRNHTIIVYHVFCVR